MKITYKKSAPAKKSYTLYTGDTPASWIVCVNGVDRGTIIGRQGGLYSREKYYTVCIDGVKIQYKPAKLKQAKRYAQQVIEKVQSC